MFSFIEAALCTLLGLSPGGAQANNAKKKPQQSYSAHSVTQPKGGGRNGQEAIELKTQAAKNAWPMKPRSVYAKGKLPGRMKSGSLTVKRNAQGVKSNTIKLKTNKVGGAPQQ